MSPMRYILMRFVLSGERFSVLAERYQDRVQLISHPGIHSNRINDRCDHPAIPHILGCMRVVHMYAQNGKASFVCGCVCSHFRSITDSSRSENDLGQLYQVGFEMIETSDNTAMPCRSKWGMPSCMARSDHDVDCLISSPRRCV